MAITYWGNAVGLARSGHPEDAAARLENLNQLLSKSREQHDDYWASQIEIQIAEARAWIAHAKGQQGEAVSLLSIAATEEEALEKHPVTPGAIGPAREQLGDLFLDLHRPADALREYEAVLVVSPGRRGSLSGAARASEETGDSVKLRTYRNKLRVL